MSCYSKPSPDTMTEYNKKVEFLKGLIETQKMVRRGSMFWNFKMGICCCIQIRKNIVVETTRKCLSSENISQIILYIICMLSILPLVASKRGHETKKLVLIECFHMTSRRPCWCPKKIKRPPCWCPKPILWELNSFLMQTLSFVLINLHRCWPREWKHSIGCLLLDITCFAAKHLKFDSR